MHIDDRHGHRVVRLAPEGPVLASAADAIDLIGNASYQEVDVLAVPVDRLDAAFFVLGTGLAGDILQKAVNYRVTFAVIGDISAHVAASDALRDLVHESNRGDHAWFLPDEDALDAVLARRAARKAARRAGGASPGS